MIKTFDCVAMKDAIQAAHAREYAGMSDEDRLKTMARKLETSDDVVAKKWRALCQREQLASR